MSDTRKFEIQVSTSFNPAGSQQATESLQNVGKATGQAGEKAETFNKHGREMHRIFGQLDRLAPGLGESLKAILSPEAAPLVGVVVALELVAKLFEKIKADGEAFNKIMEETPDFSGIKNSVESTASAMVDAARKSEEFFASINKILDAQQTVAENADKLVKTLEHQKTVEDEIARAKKDQVAAELELLKQKGQITPEQYDIAKIKLESVSAREAAQREVDYLKKEKESEESSRGTAEQNLENLGKKEKAAQDRAAAADKAVKDAEQRHAHAKTELEEVTEQIAGDKKGEKPGLQSYVNDARSKLSSQLEGMSDAELRAYLGKLNAAGGNTTMDEKIDRGDIDRYLQLADKLQALRTQQSGFAGKLRTSEGGIETAKDAKTAADAALDDVKKELTDNANSVKTLTGKIEELTRKLDEHKDDSKVFEAQDRARNAQALPGLEKDLGVDSDSGIATFVQKFFDAQNRMQHHQGTAGDSQTIGAMNQLLSGTRQSDGRLFAIIQNLVTHVGNRDTTLSSLERQVANLRSSMPRGSSTNQ